MSTNRLTNVRNYYITTLVYLEVDRMSEDSIAKQQNPPWSPMSGSMRSYTPWCIFHIKTDENPTGTDCSAHLAEGRMPHSCLFRSFDEAKKGNCEDAKAMTPETNVSGDAKHFDLMRTADLLKIMVSAETSQEDREAAYKIVEESLQKTGIFGF